LISYSNNVDFLFKQVLEMSSTWISPCMDKPDHRLSHIFKVSGAASNGWQT